MIDGEPVFVEGLALDESRFAPPGSATRPRRADERFTVGLVLDVAAVLRDRGFPPADGRELVELELALFRLLYRDSRLGTRPQ